MPISEISIKNEIIDFHNKTGNYTGMATALTPVLIQEQVALLWKNIIIEGFSAIIPSSTTVTVAADAIESGLNVENGGYAIYSLFAAALATIGGGMVLYSTTTTPDALLLSAPVEGIEASAAILAGQIASTAKTGKSTLTVPPFTETQWQ